MQVLGVNFSSSNFTVQHVCYHKTQITAFLLKETSPGPPIVTSAGGSRNAGPKFASTNGFYLM